MKLQQIGNGHFFRSTTVIISSKLVHSFMCISSGSKWLSRRQILTLSFHFEILEDLLHVVNEQAAILVRHLDKMVDQPAFDIQPLIHHVTLDIICGKTRKNINLR